MDNNSGISSLFSEENVEAQMKLSSISPAKM